jgi:hypothetical protein
MVVCRQPDASATADGLVSIERHPEIDQRKPFLTPTKKLERLVEGELMSLAADLRHSDLTSAARLEDATLSVRPSSDNLLPIDWPPDDVGASIK